MLLSLFFHSLRFSNACFFYGLAKHFSPCSGYSLFFPSTILCFILFCQCVFPFVGIFVSAFELNVAVFLSLNRCCGLLFQLYEKKENSSECLFALHFIFDLVSILTLHLTHFACLLFILYYLHISILLFYLFVTQI